MPGRRYVPGVDRLLALARRLPLVGAVLDVHKRFSEVHGGFLASAVTLAAFVSILPLLLLVTALAGFVSAGDVDLSGRVIDGLGLDATDQTAKLVRDAFARAEANRRLASALGLAGLLWTSLGFVSAVGSAFDAVWQAAGRGIKGKLYGLAWLVGAGLVFVASFALTAALNFLPGEFAAPAVAVGFLVDLAFWLWTLTVLTNRKVGWRGMLPGAVLGAVGLQVLRVAGSIYVPRVVASSSALYGTLGVVFAVLAWLLFFGRLVVYAAVVNVVRWERRHGTVTAEIELPRVPGEVPVAVTRSGEAQPAATGTAAR